jgi:hypothetical protein
MAKEASPDSVVDLEAAMSQAGEGRSTSTKLRSTSGLDASRAPTRPSLNEALPVELVRLIACSSDRTTCMLSRTCTGLREKLEAEAKYFREHRQHQAQIIAQLDVMLSQVIELIP